MNLFVGDSLGLPRPNFGVRYEDTIPYQLAEKGNVWMLSHTGATVGEFKDIVTELSHMLPDQFFHTAVIQLGLSDCAPRPLAIQWRNQLSKVRPLSFRNLIVRGIHKYRPFIQRYLGYYQRTTYPIFKRDFDKLLKMVLMLSQNTTIILMPPVQNSLEEHSPGIRKEITKYNECMKELGRTYRANVIDAVENLGANPKRYLTNDGHLTREGNRIIINELKEAVL